MLFGSDILLCLPSSFVFQPPIASQKPQYSWIPRCLLSFSPLPRRRQETPGVACPCLSPSTQHTPPNWERLSLLVILGALPCHLSAGSHLLSHTQDYNLSHREWFAFLGYEQRVVFPASISPSEEGFRTNRKWVYWEESEKEPWKENLGCLHLCLFIIR